MAYTRVIILGNMTKAGVPETIEALKPWFERLVTVLGVLPADRAGPDDVRPADLCMVFGGDGTLLQAARNVAAAGVPLLGVNMGKLGFLAEFTVDVLQNHLEAILAGQVAPTERMMLEMTLRRGDADHFQATALNDVVIQAGEPFRMIDLDVSQDGGTISRYLGDGLAICTPTGSTAYNLSVGGPILEPTLDAIVITPFAPHTLALRPIVVRSHNAIHITATRVNAGSAVIIDGQATMGLADGDTVCVRRSETVARIIPCPGRTFFETLSSKLQWGQSPHHSV